MKITLAQINLTVCHLRYNQKKIIGYIKKAQAEDVDIVVFPELMVCGYLPEDFLYHQQFT
jgi:NAD+ synthase (glutamine-hydrolysing)